MILQSWRNRCKGFEPGNGLDDHRRRRQRLYLQYADTSPVLKEGYRPSVGWATVHRVVVKLITDHDPGLPDDWFQQ